MTTTIQQRCNHLQKLLIEDADRLGRESRFIQPQQKLTRARFMFSLCVQGSRQSYFL